MKKSTISIIALALCVLLTAFSLCACGNNNSKASLVGSWEYEGGSYIYTFNEDGTGIYEAAGSELEFTYKDNGNSIEITYDNTTDPYVYEYRIDGDSLIIKDSIGSDVKYNKK